MIIIEKKDLDLYRYSVAKIIFLRVYEEYTFLEDVKGSNCLLARKGQERFYISIFGKPTIDLGNFNLNSNILIYYQKPKFSRNRNKFNNGLVYELSDEFDEQYNIALNEAILFPNKFIKDNKQFDLFLEDIKINAFVVHDTSGKLYKYYSTRKVKENKYGINDGYVSFLNPSCFNDPFDCSYVLPNRKSVSNKFRVLCTIQDPKNILMWSYYGEDHKGYCFEYSKHEIVSELINLNIDGLCIMGRVQYADDRPYYTSPTKTFSYNNIKSIIESTFTKFKKWQHEEEYRFVIVSDSFSDENVATTLKVSIHNIFNGCKGDGMPVLDSNNELTTVRKLIADDENYKLI